MKVLIIKKKSNLTLPSEKKISSKLCLEAGNKLIITLDKNYVKQIRGDREEIYILIYNIIIV